MSILTYTVRSDYPRTHFTSSDKTALTNLTNATASWKTQWDGEITTGVNALIGATDLSIVDDETCIDYFFALGLYGWIESSTSAHNKLLSAAKYLAANSSLWPDWDSVAGRLYCIAMAYAYEFLRTGVITFSAADRAIVGGMVQDYAEMKGWPSAVEWFHGHGPGDYMAVLYAGCVLAGEYGSGYDFRTAATALIDEALDMWYGATATSASRLEVVRYFYADGGTLEGGSYVRLSTFQVLWMLDCVAHAFVQNTETPNSLQLNGQDYAPFTDETWVAKLPEYLLWWQRRGDGDMWGVHDTSRSYPWYHSDARRQHAVLIKQGGSWRKQIRWLRDQLDAENTAQGYGGWYQHIHDVGMWDPADTDNASVAPKDASPAIATTRFFDPPGSFWHRNSWDYSNSCVINIEVPEWYAYYGHGHLLCGAMQIGVHDDIVLCNTGCYRSVADSSNYGGSHHRTWYQQSISHSGIPLIHKSGLGHTNRNESGVRVTYPSGLGGQLWKRRWTGSAWQYEPQSLDNLLTDDSNVGWKIATSSMEDNDANLAFVYTDMRRAYLYEPDDYGTADERVTCCETKHLVIKGESTYPIILFVTRVTATNNLYVKRQQFHSYRQWNVSYPHGEVGDTKRFTTSGYKNTGKCVIDHYNWTDFTAEQVGGGTRITGDFYSHQFDIQGINYPPTIAINERWPLDIGMYRQDVIAAVQRPDEYFVFLIWPMAAGGTPQEFEWVNLADWFGVKFATTGHEYHVHKTQALCEYIGSGDEPDTTPPAAPTGLAATTGSTQITLTWTPNSEDDMKEYDVWYREKV